MKILFLHSRLSGYFMACVSALRDQGAEIAIAAQPAAGNAPFDIESNTVSLHLGSDDVDEFANAFAPDCIVLGGWSNPEHLKIARAFRRNARTVVLAIDEPWTGTWKQRIKLRMIRRRIAGAASHIWIPGRPQQALASYLGFSPCQIRTGVYTCDLERFQVPRVTNLTSLYFLFVGRLEEVKGISTLLSAYSAYASNEKDPWELKLVGSGSLVPKLENRSGVEHIPFVQPADLPELHASASAFVMPSRYEPWGVAIHEAAVAGLPLICSDRCGAADHLLHNNYNGLRFRSESVRELTECLTKISRMSQESRDCWGKSSQELATQFTPQRWVHALLDVARENCDTA